MPKQPTQKVRATFHHSQTHRMWCCDRATCDGHPTPFHYTERTDLEGYSWSRNFGYWWNR